MAKEWERYSKTTVGSADHAARSVKTLRWASPAASSTGIRTRWA